MAGLGRQPSAPAPGCRRQPREHLQRGVTRCPRIFVAICILPELVLRFGCPLLWGEGEDLCEPPAERGLPAALFFLPSRPRHRNRRRRPPSAPALSSRSVTFHPHPLVRRFPP